MIRIGRQIDSEAKRKALIFSKRHFSLASLMKNSSVRVNKQNSEIHGKAKLHFL